MSTSPSIAFYLAMHARTGKVPQGQLRIDGDNVWLHGGTVEHAALLARLAESLMHLRPDVQVLLTHPAAMPPLPELPGRITHPLDTRDRAACEALITACRPAALVMSGPRLLPALIATAARHDIPVMLAGVDTPRLPGAWRFMPGLVRASLRAVSHIFLPDASKENTWLVAGAQRAQITTSGPLSISPRALSCNQAERDALAEQLRHRTVWLAIGVPEGEEDMIAQTHQKTLRSSHRLMLILHPQDPHRGPALAEALRARFATALRSNDDPIGQDTQVYIADTEGERGLWYRLSTATYMGGSMSSDGSSFDPIEAAALGCAILHGPYHGTFDDSFAALHKAKATRRVTNDAALGDAVTDVLRPDVAARLAHQGWKVISSGAETSDRVIDALLACLDARGQA